MFLPLQETKRPSKEMQVTIARQLGLEPSTVGNFFMNARRRSMDKWKDDNEGLPGQGQQKAQQQQQQQQQMCHMGGPVMHMQLAPQQQQQQQQLQTSMVHAFDDHDL